MIYNATSDLTVIMGEGVSYDDAMAVSDAISNARGKFVATVGN